MNKQQPDPLMNDEHFEDKMLDLAWGKVENSFRSAGMIDPLPGFTNRWMARLEVARQKEERKQAWALIFANLVIAIGFVILIGIQYVPSASSGGLVSVLVEIVSRVVLFVQMVTGLVGALLRTLPGLVPTSWWVGGIGMVGLAVALWVSMVRRHIRGQGVNHE